MLNKTVSIPSRLFEPSKISLYGYIDFPSSQGDGLLTCISDHQFAVCFGPNEQVPRTIHVYGFNPFLRLQQSFNYYAQSLTHLGSGYLAAACGNNMTIWSLDTGDIATEIYSSKGTSVLMGISDKFLLQGCQDGAVLLWNWLAKNPILSLQGFDLGLPAPISYPPYYPNQITCMAISTNTLLACGSNNGDMQIWDLYQKTLMYTTTFDVQSLLFSTETLLLGTTRSGELASWDISDFSNVTFSSFKLHKTRCDSVFGIDTSHIVTGSSDHSIKVTHIDSPSSFTVVSSKKVTDEHSNKGVDRVIYLKAHQLLVTAHSGRKVRIWRLQNFL